MVQTLTTDPTLQVSIDRIVAKFDPDQIILFGSRARGDQRPDSDYDLLIVLPEVVDIWEPTADAYEELGYLPMSKDLVVAPPQTRLPRGATSAPSYARRFKKALSHMSALDPRTLAREWLAWPAADLRAAHVVLDHPDADARHAGFLTRRSRHRPVSGQRRSPNS